MPDTIMLTILAAPETLGPGAAGTRASVLAAADLGRLRRVSLAFCSGRLQWSGRSMVEEAARQVVALRTDRCRAEPRRTGESFASILHDLEALSEPLRLTPQVESLPSGANLTRTPTGGVVLEMPDVGVEEEQMLDSQVISICDELVMTRGQHYAEFSVSTHNTGVLAGIIPRRVFDGIEDGKVTGDRHRELAEDRGTAANSSLAEAGWSVWLTDGQRWQEGNDRADFNDSWDGQASFGDDDIIGLLFDATEGSLVAYKNGVKLGFVFEAGEIPTKHGMSRTALEPSRVLGYCWAVDVLYHGQGVEVLNVNPALLEAHNASRLQHVMFEGHNDQASSEED